MKKIHNKTYLFTYLDKKGNELKSYIFEAYNMSEAKQIRDKLFAECMLNDCVKIKIAFVCK